MSVSNVSMHHEDSRTLQGEEDSEDIAQSHGEEEEEREEDEEYEDEEVGYELRLKRHMQVQHIQDAIKNQSFNWSMLTKLYPKCQSMVKKLCEKYAWWNHGPSVEWVLDHWLKGRLPNNNGATLYEHRYHIRPVALLGRAFHPAVSKLGKGMGDLTNEEEGGMADVRDLAYNLCAFDLIDARGKVYQLLAEYRTDCCPDAPGYTQHGMVACRVTGQALSESTACDESRADITLKEEFVTKLFKDYVPHGIFTSDEMNEQMSDDLFAEARPDFDDEEEEESKPSSASLSPSSSSESPAATAVIDEAPSKLSTKVLNELKAMFCGGLGLSVHMTGCISMLPTLHPSTLTRRFRLELMKKVFDQIENAPIDDLKLLIADYADISLPYVPLSSEPIIDSNGKVMPAVAELMSTMAANAKMASESSSAVDASHSNSEPQTKTKTESESESASLAVDCWWDDCSIPTDFKFGSRDVDGWSCIEDWNGPFNSYDEDE